MSDAAAPTTTTDQLRRALSSLQDLRSRLEAVEAGPPRADRHHRHGLPAARAPTTPTALWELLRGGGDAITETPADRWDADALYDPIPRPPARSPRGWGGFLDDIDRLRRRLLRHLAARGGADGPAAAPAARGGLGGARGRRPARRPARRHARPACSSACTATATTTTRCRPPTPPASTCTAAPGTSHSVVSGRLSYLLDLRGPSLAVDTACSSSLVAVHLAVQSLRRGECALALVGGRQRHPRPDVHDGRVADADDVADRPLPAVRRRRRRLRARRGLRRRACSSGCRDAVADGDRVLAVIRGSAVNQDGRSNGLTAPNGLAQEAVIRAALADAGADAGRGRADRGPRHRHAARRPDRGRGAGRRVRRPPPTGARAPSARSRRTSATSRARPASPALIKAVLGAARRRGPAAGALPTRSTRTSTWPARRSSIPTALAAVAAPAARPRGRGQLVRLVRHQRPRGRRRGARRAAAVAPPAGRACVRCCCALSARDDRRPALALARRTATCCAGADGPAAARDLRGGRRPRRSHHAAPARRRRPRRRPELVEQLDAVRRRRGPRGARRVGRSAAVRGGRSSAFVFPGQGSQWAGHGAGSCWPPSRSFRDAVERVRRGDRPPTSAGRCSTASIDADDVDSTTSTSSSPTLFAIQVALAALWRRVGRRARRRRRPQHGRGRRRARRRDPLARRRRPRHLPAQPPAAPHRRARRDGRRRARRRRRGRGDRRLEDRLVDRREQQPRRRPCSSGDPDGARRGDGRARRRPTCSAGG